MTESNPQTPQPPQAPEPGPAPTPQTGPSSSSPGYQPTYQQPTYYPQGYHPQAYYPAPGPYYASPPTGASGRPPRRPRRKWAMGLGGGVVAAALIVGGVAIADTATSPVAGSGSLAEVLPSVGSGSTGSGSTGSSGSGSTGSSGSGSTGSGSTGGGLGGTGGGLGGGTSSGSDGSSTATAATSSQQVGIVTVLSVLKYQNAESAGTGMILTSNGEILTNNHVVDGATSITVTVESTGKTYRAAVVGTSPTNDVAVLQLQGASGLTTAKLADSSSSVKVDDAVIGVGNAGGTGSLSASSGKVTALDQSITATDDTGQNAEKLSGLIQIDAGIISGDSGGPLYDAAGDVVGMDTAASTGQQTAAAYAITISHATSIAAQIESGVETTAIHIGLPGFLGIGVDDSTSGGAVVSSLLQGGPAAAAGITTGSTITKINGTAITSSTALRTTLTDEKPGTKVSVDWTDTAGTSHSATVTLATGPAD